MWQVSLSTNGLEVADNASKIVPGALVLASAGSRIRVGKLTTYPCKRPASLSASYLS